MDQVVVNVDLLKARFDTSDVVLITKNQQAALQRRLTRGDIELDRTAPGHGRDREYDLYDLWQLGLLHKFEAAGLRLSVASKISRRIRKQFLEGTPGYGLDPKIGDLTVCVSNWVIVAPETVWPNDHPAAVVARADEYLAVLSVLNPKAPFPNKAGFLMELVGLCGVVTVLNLDRFLSETVVLAHARIQGRVSQP